jgi:PAS domain S-box-containing protein
MFETVDEGIYVVDGDGDVTYANRAYADLVGSRRDEIVGSHVSAIAHDDVIEEAKAVEADLAAGDCDTGAIQTILERPSGERWTAEARFSLMPSDSGYERISAVRDVTGHVERQRELEARMQRQSVVADLGQRAVESHDLDDLLAHAAEVVSTTLGADYCKVLDLQDADEELLLRQGVGWDDDVVGTATVSAVENESQAAYTLTCREPVVVEDLDAHDAISGPALLTEHDTTSGISTIVGPFEDPWGILGVHDTDRREFTSYDVTFLQSVATVLAAAIERAEREAELDRQRREAAALNSLHDVVGDITDAVVEQSEREQIEATVCRRLADAESYSFAWIGDVHASDETVDVRASANLGDYLDDVTISVDPDDERSRGPTGRAFLTNEVQVSRDVPSDPRHDPWRETVDERGVRSSAAVPVVHEDTTYGVLNVYSERRYAFDEQEHEVFARLGEVVGHAIAAAERKRALMSDALVELAFTVRDPFAGVAVDVDDLTLDLTDVVPVDGDDYLMYGTIGRDDRETMQALADAMPHWSDVSFRERQDGDAFELRSSNAPVLSTVASLGGSVETVRLEDGNMSIRLQLAPSVNVRRAIETVEREFPDAELLRRVQVSRDRTEPFDVRRRLASALTDRQERALTAAYRAGYFEWPRGANGESVAASLDVAPPTFHQHLRKAEKTVLDAILAADDE